MGTNDLHPRVPAVTGTLILGAVIPKKSLPPDKNHADSGSAGHHGNQPRSGGAFF